MLTLRSPRAGAVFSSEALAVRKSFNCQIVVRKQCISHIPVGTCGRALTVAVFARKEHNEHRESEDIEHRYSSRAELQAYIDRERFLLSELSAARSQMDKLLDQQRMLLDMIARLSGLSGASRSSSAPAPSPSPPQALQQPQLQERAAAVQSPASTQPTSTPSWDRAPTCTSSDVPALNSLADLFKSTATAVPHPASAAAAASIAAAISAVDHGDILSINKFDIPAGAPPASLPQPPLLFDTSGGFTAIGASALSTPMSYSQTSGSKEAAPAAPAAEAEMPVEVAKAAPTDPPPDLVQGDDDIYWLSRLHSGLEGKGFFPGDDDMENWFFGEGTLAAVLAFQASERLPETGVVDRGTWTALLGADVAAELYDRVPAGAAATEASGALSSSARGSSSSSSSSSATTTAADASSSSSSVPSTPWRSAASAATGGALQELTKWPVLMEGDGGKEVHALQVALANNGFHCGEDDMRWWQFGDATLTALKFYQSCNSLPESGVCDERCWRALLGADATPSDIFSLRLAVLNSDDEDGGYEDDMDGVSQGRVWLLGEQRWERRT